MPIWKDLDVRVGRADGHTLEDYDGDLHRISVTDGGNRNGAGRELDTPIEAEA